MSLLRALRLLLFLSPMCAFSVPYPVFIGTYGRQSGAGIYRVTFDPAAGTLAETQRVAQLVRPSFLCYSPDNRFLYAISQADDSIVAFAVDHAIGTLKELNRQPLGVAGACFVAVDQTGRALIAISYGDAAVVAFPIHPDGTLAPRSSFFQHEGRGPNQPRQDKAHAHSATVSPDNRFVYVCDLGLDRVVAYRLDAATASLTRAPDADGVSPAGVGPRHAKMTSDGRFLYVVDELAGSISIFERDLGSGVLRRIETVSTLRDDAPPGNTSSEIRLHPNERFVYAANRGPDDLAVFARDAASGRLQRIQIISTEGAHPRHFSLSPDGRWLICANRDSNSLVVFAVDPATGRLSSAGHRTTVPEPVCVLFPNL